MNEADETRQLDELFRLSKGQPVEWSGRLLWKAYKIQLGSRFERATISVRAFKDDPVQGICLRLKSGQLEVEGQKSDGMVFWMDTAPTVLDIGIYGERDSVLEVWNCWRGKFGERAAWLRNAGLFADAPDDRHYRFCCSDGPGPVDFTALDFDLTLGG